MKTNLDDVLREEWSCEHCRTLYSGVNPPNECDVCGHTLFDNSLDLAANEGVLPVPTRSAMLQGARTHS